MSNAVGNDRGMATRRFTTNAHVAAMLDGVDELPCAFCTASCPVPDYVLAVRQHDGKHEPVAVCQSCSDTLLVFAEGLAQAAGER